MRRLALFIIVAVGLSACAQVPIVNERQLLQEAAGKQSIRVYGTRGPLSARQAAKVLARVAAQAPNADALARHLAVEQIVAKGPLYAGNSVRVLQDGAATFPAMFSTIAGAKHFLDIEYYIFQDVQSGGRDLGDLLVQKARSGVQVRIIYDAVGSLGTPAAFYDKLRAGGVHLVQYNPINPLKARTHYSLNDRDHRKTLVADDEIGIVGGVNLSTDYESAPSLHPGVAKTPSPSGHPVWHDTDLEIRGPVVPQLSRLFDAHWREQKGPPIAPVTPPAKRVWGTQIVRVIGSSPAKLKTRYYTTVLTAVRTAQTSVWMTAAYFVPTHQELRTLKRAAARGVDVRIILPSESDEPEVLAVQRSYYAGLLRAGIKVYERQAGIMHSKTMVVDGVWSLVGSSNFDQRSILFNDEVDVVVLGSAAASALQKGMEADMQHARRIDSKFVHQQGIGQHTKAWFWRLWQRLL
ncbi:MAG TPA: phospholipase D-like domain-containing protein [Steroidobacteraceae bacterium]|jgi:cardiolipin synthase|nr:phospholipase D-like domain-containing protein [Steroidobacteraceae bacterium]